MSSTNSVAKSTPTSRIRAPYPYFNAVIYEQLAASDLPIHVDLPQTSRGWWTHSVEAAAYASAIADEPSATRKMRNFLAEFRYVRSVPDKCAGLHLPWKSEFSRTNRHFWSETLKHAVRETLKDEGWRTDKSVDEAGIHRFVEVLEDAIFQRVARDPAEYGNSMAAKYDAIRGGDFPKEERLLLQQCVCL